MAITFPLMLLLVVYFIKPEFILGQNPSGSFLLWLFPLKHIGNGWKALQFELRFQTFNCTSVKNGEAGLYISMATRFSSENYKRWTSVGPAGPPVMFSRSPRTLQPPSHLCRSPYCTSRLSRSSNSFLLQTSATNLLS